MTAGRVLPSAAAVLALALAGALAPAPAEAASGTANCTGFITSLPATISQQGVWCLAGDLVDSASSGKAIEVTTNNVTVDCNGYALVGTVGAASLRIGIFANQRGNLTVRGCELRGFSVGVFTGGGGGHLIEDNRFQGNWANAIRMDGGTANMVRRNRIYDTGGTTVLTTPGVIRASADIIDNVIDGIVKFSDSITLEGIVVSSSGSEVSRNIVRGFDPTGNGFATGIAATLPQVTLSDNVVITSTPKKGGGIYASGPTGMCTGNQVLGFSGQILNCGQSSGNISGP